MALPHLPDGGTLIDTAFGNAYIRPIYVDPGPGSLNVRGTVSFTQYLKDDFAAIEVSRDLPASAPLFWTTLVVGCFEATPETDGDPDGVAAPVLGAPPVEQDSAFDYGVSRASGGNTSIIYLETIDDFVRQKAVFTDESHTVVHEIGHTAGTGINGHDVAWNGIMQAAAPVSAKWFDNVHLGFFRQVETW